jgi:pimeloyl-ACP methyl ester carboxylesterase
MRPFRIDFPREAMDDLHRRLDRTRWPGASPEADWGRGVPQDYLRELAHYWRTGYSWAAAQDRLNSYPQHTTSIDGATIHFLHVRSTVPDATPLILTHGWPGSFVDFLEVIDPLTAPGPDGTAFHLVIPSLPGFGFSGSAGPGWTVPRTAAAWAELMRRLGYSRYLAQGGDLGAWVSMALAGLDRDHVTGLHLNFLPTPPPDDPAALAGLTPTELGRLGRLATFVVDQSGYMATQATRPQTIAYPLVDSPLGLLAWIVEKVREWSDCEKVPEEAVDRDLLLTNVTLYWLTATAGSAAHFYCDNAAIWPTAPTPPAPPAPIDIRAGVAVFPADPGQPVRRFAEPILRDIVRWTEYDRGGHFPALEEPDLFVADLRAFAAAVR